MFTIDCRGLGFREVNLRLRRAVKNGFNPIRLTDVNGHRYICAGVKAEVGVRVYGVAGNDLGIFMNGPMVEVYGNAGDGLGNTMNGGIIIVHGFVGDVAGYSMRGGRIYVEGDAGYRLGIHMKEYGSSRPVIVVGGCVRDFLGEYMAGGVIVVLGLTSDEPVRGRFIAAGMHGGVIYVRGMIERDRLGYGATVANPVEGDYRLIEWVVEDFSRFTRYSTREVLSDGFTKIVPISRRPYKILYNFHRRDLSAKPELS